MADNESCFPGILHVRCRDCVDCSNPIDEAINNQYIFTKDTGSRQSLAIQAYFAAAKDSSSSSSGSVHVIPCSSILEWRVRCLAAGDGGDASQLPLLEMSDVPSHVLQEGDRILRSLEQEDAAGGLSCGTEGDEAALARDEFLAVALADSVRKRKVGARYLDFSNNGVLNANSKQDPNNSSNNNNDDSNDIIEQEEDSIIELPESIYTLLFTEAKIMSFPFLFAALMLLLSFACILLALMNVLSEGEGDNILNVPAGVGPAVTIAQYVAVFVGVLMDEEIPQAIILLRNISSVSFYQTYPQRSYRRFVLSCLLRLVMGYLFLLALFVITVQAGDVLQIFFDILALQFVEQIDDVSFRLARKDMMGKSLLIATKQIKPVMKVKPIRQKHDNNECDDDSVSTPTCCNRLTKCRNKYHCTGLFLKSIYFINISLLLSGMETILKNQINGDYQCKTLSVTFGDEVWKNAIVKNNTRHHQQHATEQRMLAYSYFNGSYKRNGTHDGYPRYTEQNKLDGNAFRVTKGAVIQYCKSEKAWVFMHEDIVQSEASHDSDCPWLLRSPETNEYDIVKVPTEWSIWTGVIHTGSKISIVCNECKQDSDCNYHGECLGGKCDCYQDQGYFGPFCDLEQPCEELIGDMGNYWTVATTPNGKLSSYMRPVYLNYGNIDFDGWVNSTNGNDYDPNADDGFSQAQEYAQENLYKGDEISAIALLYTGSRWFATFESDVFDDGTLSKYTPEYHAFWENPFAERTYALSSPTSRSTPVGADFFLIIDRGEDYGPFGLLFPTYNISGIGFFHCYDDNEESLA